ncbi:hypothetical protein B5F40_11080 [Gordonibacter sp. An230]|uniref:helix-turn-helix domain-containing protein n=1 Tax=Gordonibacter sp. An230 TaxID=1965592 RepID=UPI000B370377|nr:helix-turn-helix transcriptional regulator [Gordonibacter sp. An230]OUO89421.1 hypothetical protein B5F40_11080 [Gordonibacter sp. An230]
MGDTGKETYRSVFADRLRKFSNEAFTKRMIGFTFSRAWVFLVFFNGAVAPASPAERLATTSIYQGSLIALVLTLFVCGALDDRCERLLRGPIERSLPALLCIVGTSVEPFAQLSEGIGAAMLVIASMATGVGSGLLTLFWGKIYSLEGGPCTAAEVSVAYVLAASLMPLYGMLPLSLQMTVVAVLPIASSVLMVRELDRMSLEHGLKNEPLQEGADLIAAEGRPPSDYVGMLVKFSVGSIVFGCCISMMQSLYTSYEAPSGTEAYSIFTFPLAALLVSCIMLGILLFSRRLDLAFSYKTVLIFTAAGCLLTPFFEANAFLNHFLAYVFVQTGYFCFEIISWVMLADMSLRFAVPPLRAYGFGRCAVSGGVLLGSLSSSLLASSVEFSWQLRFAVSCLMVFAVVVTYTLTLTERDIARVHRHSMRCRERQGKKPSAIPDASIALEPRLEREPEALSLEERVGIVADRVGVSGRMREVMLLLAQGRSAARIEQELYISRGTVNTYSHRLYQKLGIHSRQELLDLIYGTERPDREQAG